MSNAMPLKHAAAQWRFNFVNEWRDGDWRWTWRATIPLPYIHVSRTQVLFAWFCLGVHWWSSRAVASNRTDAG